MLELPSPFLADSQPLTNLLQRSRLLAVVQSEAVGNDNFLARIEMIKQTTHGSLSFCLLRFRHPWISSMIVFRQQ